MVATGDVSLFFTKSAEGAQVDKRHDSVMTIDEFSVYLKVAKSTLHKLSREGQLPGQKIGRHWRFRREAVDA